MNKNKTANIKNITAALMSVIMLLSAFVSVPCLSAEAATTSQGVSVVYQTHVESVGWQAEVKNGEMSGTSGRSLRLEGIRIRMEGASELGIQYTTHCEKYGWLPWSANGEMNGTEGESKRLEAIKLQLTGSEAASYDVYYRVHAESYGWLGWAKNGQAAGTAGLSKRLEGIQIKVVDKGAQAPNDCQGISSNRQEAYISSTGDTDITVSGAETVNVTYRTHVERYGWQGWKHNGTVSGTSGESKRLEGINIKLGNKKYSGEILYRTHVERYGWQGWVSDGTMAGTSGESKRLESIQIYLTGEMAKHYDIYYRVHAESFGWLGWVKNGEPAGTAGYSKRLEAIQIILAEKNAGAPGNVAGISSVTATGFQYKNQSQIPDNPYVEPKEEANTNQNQSTTEKTPGANEEIDVTKYTYKITPIFAPFNHYYFVETDNPYPGKIRFVDSDSKYVEDGEMSYLEPSYTRFIDVDYDDERTGRVNGGYIFVCRNGSFDGGNVQLQEAQRDLLPIMLNEVYYSGNTALMPYYDRDVWVECEAVMSTADYLIETYTDDTMDFFQKLSAVQDGLYDISVYPRYIINSDKVNETHPYPKLVASSYSENSVYKDYEVYADDRQYMFLASIYPFVLDSLEFPGTMSSVAKRLDPSCTVERTNYHAYIDVTLNGETHSYGGAGTGGSGYLCSSYVDKVYTFDGSENDFATVKEFDKIIARFRSLAAQSDEHMADVIAQLEDEKIYSIIGNGSWMTVATEGFGYGKTITYGYYGNHIVYGDQMYYPEDVWVDGRYVNVFNRWEPDATYEEYPNADILITDLTYCDYYGNEKTRDMVFYYDEESDTWSIQRRFYFTYSFDGLNKELPDNLILTREEVDAMNVDRNTSDIPEFGYCFDGTVPVGTEFNN